jgi:hypothetical protein
MPNLLDLICADTRLISHRSDHEEVNRRRMTMSNVISLEQHRKQKSEQPELQVKSSGAPKRINALRAAGFVLLLPTIAMLFFVGYQAARLGILSDTLVVGILFALAGYLAAGATLVRAGGRRATAELSAIQRRTSVKTNAAKPSDEEVLHSPVVLEFPTAYAATGGLISIRCARCASRFIATRTDLSCPTCGTASLAG